MKTWTISLLAAIAIEAQAGDYVYKYLVVTDAKGNVKSLTTEGLKLMIADGSLVAVNSEGTAAFTLTQLASMALSETALNTATAMETLPVTQETAIEAFTLGGVSLGTFSNMSQLRSELVKGVYIIKQNGTTKKITVK